MADCEVKCIVKPNPLSAHEHITYVGNPYTNPSWKWSREDVIASIEAKTNTFYVLDPRTGKRSDVGVVRSAGRAPYLRTYADGDWDNNLLSLPQCT
jgi:Protein of unknown function (DUF3892)